MKLKYNNEILSGAIFSVVGILLWLLLPGQIQTLEKTAVTAQTFPKIAIGGLILFSLGLLVVGLFFRPKKEVHLTKACFQTESFRKELRSLLFAFFLIAYCLLIPHLGYVMTTLLLVLAVMLFYRARKWYAYVIPLGMVGVVYFVFKLLLKISLP